jgi:hypothetical protein
MNLGDATLYKSKPRIPLQCSGTCELSLGGPIGLGNQEAQEENAQTQTQEDAQGDEVAAPDEVTSF